jgi:phosphoglycolate phosphatase
MSILGVLFDKDGTLVDFDATWGPATHAIIRALAAGDPELMRAQAEVLHFSLDEKRFRATSPAIAGSSASLGRLWGGALGRTDFSALKLEIDRLAAVESLKALTPIGEPARALGALKAMGLRLGVATNDSEASARRHIAALGLEETIEFVAGTIPAMAASRVPAWRWRSRAISASRRGESRWSAIRATILRRRAPPARWRSRC